MAMSGGELPKPKHKHKPKHKPRVRMPKKKTLVACEKVQADNFESRTADRLDVLDYAKKRGIDLPIRRDPTPKSQKDAAKERQQSSYNEDGEDKVFCGHNLLCATKEVNDALDQICPGRHGQFSADDLEHAHTWAICDQKKNGIWGGDTCHEVHLLQSKCHAKVDAELLKSQAAERRAEKEKAAERRASKRRACTKKRRYVEIFSDEEDELNDTCHEDFDRIRRHESDADEQDDDEVFEVFECPDCGEHGCECPPRYVGP
jgi:hypothetical protein